MMRTPGPPRVSTFPDERAVAHALADRVGTELAERRPWCSGSRQAERRSLLPGAVGAGRAGQGRSVSRHHVQSDEFVGIPSTHPGSFRSFMNTHLSRVNLAAERIHFLTARPGHAGGVRATSARSRRPVESTCRSSVSAPTATSASTSRRPRFSPGRTASLEPDTRRDNAGLFGAIRQPVPAEALSMGIATILQLATDTADSDGLRKGVDCRTTAARAGDDGRAGVVPAGPLRRRVPARRGGSSASGSLDRGSRSRCRILADCHTHRVLRLLQPSKRLRRVTVVFCITIAALTFHLARLSSASASS